MRQIKVSSPTGHSQSGFDVYYFEIHHRHKPSQGVSVCVFVCVSFRVYAQWSYVLIIFVVPCKSAFVCMSVGCFHTSEKGLKALPNK